MSLALDSPLHLDATWWTLFVCLGTALAFVHAYRKLSPYFAVAWFGSGLVFGWFWTTNRTAPEALLLPVFVTYLAAALTKGVVEQGRFAGNHLVHVLCAGLFAGLVALPLEAACATMSWTTPHAAPAMNLAAIDGAWFGGANPATLVQWSLLGTLFYGTYKLLDHIGVGAVVQTIGLFAVMPFLPRFAEFLLRFGRAA